jgi:hypothetical protein
MATVNDVFHIPHHGSYPSDGFRWRRVCDFYDLREGSRYEMDDAVVQILLGFIRRVWPEATEASVRRYGNKEFTIVAHRVPLGEYLFLYRHDFSWMIGAVDAAEYKKYKSTRHYYADLPEELPQC